MFSCLKGAVAPVRHAWHAAAEEFAKWDISPAEAPGDGSAQTLGDQEVNQ